MDAMSDAMVIAARIADHRIDKNGRKLVDTNNVTVETLDAIKLKIRDRANDWKPWLYQLVRIKLTLWVTESNVMCFSNVLFSCGACCVRCFAVGTNVCDNECCDGENSMIPSGGCGINPVQL
jgi:hypothetical protein